MEVRLEAMEPSTQTQERNATSLGELAAWARRETPLVLVAFALFACGGGDDGASGTGDDDENFKACDLLTQADATAIFDQPAEPEAGPVVTDPDYLGDCSWRYDTPDGQGMKVLSLNVWGDSAYYSPGLDAEPVDIGDQGSLNQQGSPDSDGGWGIDVSWTQGDVTASLGYFTIRAGIPDRQATIDEVKALALTISERL